MIDSDRRLNHVNLIELFRRNHHPLLTHVIHSYDNPNPNLDIDLTYEQ